MSYIDNADKRRIEAKITNLQSYISEEMSKNRPNQRQISDWRNEISNLQERLRFGKNPDRGF